LVGVDPDLLMDGFGQPGQPASHESASWQDSFLRWTALTGRFAQGVCLKWHLSSPSKV